MTTEPEESPEEASGPGITIGVRHYNAATGRFTVIREPRTFYGGPPFLAISGYPPCECPRCRTESPE